MPHIPRARRPGSALPEELTELTSNPLALALYSVRDELAAGREPILARIAEYGYGAVEPMEVVNDPERLRDELDRCGLTACSTHAELLGDGDADAAFRGTQIVGAGTVIAADYPQDRFTSADGIRAVAADLNQLAARAAGYGLRLGYHNHDFELSTVIDGRTGLEILAGALDPGVILQVDTYWAAVGGQDVPALLLWLGDRVRYLHVKDGPVNKEDPMTAVGAGRMPFTEILTANPAVEWHIVELDYCATDMMRAVADSASWLLSHGLARAGNGGPGQ
jgi:sugar phosphate isomerase/epimerase